MAMKHPRIGFLQESTQVAGKDLSRLICITVFPTAISAHRAAIFLAHPSLCFAGVGVVRDPRRAGANIGVS